MTLEVILYYDGSAANMKTRVDASKYFYSGNLMDIYG